MSYVCSLIQAAQGHIKSDLVIKNVSLINVFSQETERADIAIYQGKIVGIGSYQGEKEIDGTGMYASPGFIDSHVHIESSMTTPPFFSEELLKRGVTTIIADPHEIANVLGTDGLEFMLKQGEQSVIDIYYMLPSCVPATAFENSGAALRAEDLKPFQNRKNVLGLGEVMDVEALLSCQEDMLHKLEIFKESVIDGHGPLLSGKDLNGYLVAGIKTDHECSNVEEALEKIKRGMYVLIREGSAARNLDDLIGAITDLNFHRFLFCTDDRHADDLIVEGSVDYSIRRAIELGLDPVRALTMASFNAAQAYNLKNLGALAPGYQADLVLFTDIQQIKIDYVIKNGVVHYSKNEEIIPFAPEKICETNKNTMVIKPVTLEQFQIRADGKSIHVIEVEKDSLITQKLVCSFEEKNGFVEKINCEDVLKIAVFERHKATGNYFVGYIKGLGIKNCAIAQTIAHDSHNIIVVGEKDGDMLLAVNTLIKTGGGIAIAEGGYVKGLMELPIAGLMKASPVEAIALELQHLKRTLDTFSENQSDDVFLTLSFMSLPVIPFLKITPKGLFDYENSMFLNLFC